MVNIEKIIRVTYSMTIQNKKIGLLPAVIISLLSVSLIGSWAYFLTQKNESQEIIKESEQEISMHEDLRLELSKLEDEFKSLQKDSDGKDILINAKDSLILDKQNEIKKLLSKNKLTSTELSKARGLISSLKMEVVSYKEAIGALEVENAALRVDNDRLVTQNVLVVNQRDSVDGKLRSANQTINDQAGLLNVASTLKAVNFSMEGIKVRNSGKEVETDRSRRVNKLRVSFDIAKNEVTPFGTKNLYICLYKPDSTLAKFNEEAARFIQDTKSDRKIYYSDELTFNYNSHEKIPIAFDWEQEDFQKGNYKIVVYQNGYKIGESIKALK